MPPENRKAPFRIAIMLYYLKFGGAQRVMIDLAEGFAKHGMSVDVVVFQAVGELAGKIPDGVGLVSLGSLSVTRASLAIKRYIDSRLPDAIIANGDRCAIGAYLARALSRTKPRILSVIHHDLIGILGEGNDASRADKFLAGFKKIPMSHVCRGIDAVAAVSSGAADSASAYLGLPREKIGVIYNPVMTERIRELALETPEHRWFVRPDAPLIVSVGRLSPQKDYPTLLRAFAALTQNTPARLAIIGEGPERAKLEKIIGDLGLSASAQLLGYQENPYKYIARADLLVMSSVFEGLGMVIVEAMALGTPAVSTDCPSGPAELLRNHPERLVPTRDPASLAKAMERGLAIGKEENDMREFSLDNAVERYLELIMTPKNGEYGN